MTKYRDTTLILLWILLQCGCNTSHNSSSRFTAKIHEEGVYASYHTFTVVPYSLLADEKPDSDEHGILDALVLELLPRGYQYVQDLDSANFVVTLRLSNDTRKDEYPHATYFPPSFRPVKTYEPNLEDAPPQRPLDSVQVFPRLELFLYDGVSHRCVGQFVGEAIDTDVSYLVAAKKLLPPLVAWRLPFNKDSSAHWIERPNHKATFDSLAPYNTYRTFTAIPYSLLDSASAEVSGREENAMLFSLVNYFLSAGYQYVDRLDSADFVVTE